MARSAFHVFMCLPRFFFKGGSKILMWKFNPEGKFHGTATTMLPCTSLRHSSWWFFGLRNDAKWFSYARCLCLQHLKIFLFLLFAFSCTIFFFSHFFSLLWENMFSILRNANGNALVYYLFLSFKSMCLCPFNEDLLRGRRSS